MDNNCCPDTVIYKEVMHTLTERVNQEDYYEATTVTRQKYICCCGLFFISAYLGSLRGEEVLRVVRLVFMTSNEEALVHTSKHCVLPMHRRFQNDCGVPRS